MLLPLWPSQFEDILAGWSLRNPETVTPGTAVEIERWTESRGFRPIHFS